MTEIIGQVTDWYMTNMNYGTITLLMAVESSFIPFPSEVVIPPAAWKAVSGELNIYLIVLFSTIGCIIGALFNYYLAWFLGRPVVYAFARTKIARVMLITPQSIEKAENYFIRNGAISTFIGRLIPAIRQLISIPAGLAKMHMGKFLLFTTLGSGLWNTILAVVSYVVCLKYKENMQEKMEMYYSEISYGLLVFGVLFIIYLVYQYKKTAVKSDKGNA